MRGNKAQTSIFSSDFCRYGVCKGHSQGVRTPLFVSSPSPRPPQVWSPSSSQTTQQQIRKSRKLLFISTTKRCRFMTNIKISNFTPSNSNNVCVDVEKTAESRQLFLTPFRDTDCATRRMGWIAGIISNIWDSLHSDAVEVFSRKACFR